MLRLARETNPDWTQCAVARLDDVLLDQAHCEKKAAGTALRLLFRYPEHGFLQEPLSRLAREELAHFEEVLGVLARRGVAFRRQRPARYAGRLRERVRTGEPEHLVDTLLCAALIEARSCERFQLLADAVPEPALARFYRGLLAAEARHHGVYVGLAERLAPESRVRERLDELSEWEGRLVTDSPVEPRMHG